MGGYCENAIVKALELLNQQLIFWAVNLTMKIYVLSFSMSTSYRLKQLLNGQKT